MPVRGRLLLLLAFRVHRTPVAPQPDQVVCSLVLYQISHRKGWFIMTKGNRLALRVVALLTMGALVCVLFPQITSMATMGRRSPVLLVQRQMSFATPRLVNAR